jgi:hypothetical protein
MRAVVRHSPRGQLGSGEKKEMNCLENCHPLLDCRIPNWSSSTVYHHRQMLKCISFLSPDPVSPALTSVMDRRAFTCVYEVVHLLTGYTFAPEGSESDTVELKTHYHLQHQPDKRRTDGELNVMSSPSTTLFGVTASKRLFNDWENTPIYPRWSKHTQGGPDVKSRRPSSGQIRYARKSPYITP